MCGGGRRSAPAPKPAPPPKPAPAPAPMQAPNADDGDLNIKKKKSKAQKDAMGNTQYKNTVAKTKLNSLNTAGKGTGVNITGG